jgi:hypothetical protein
MKKNQKLWYYGVLIHYNNDLIIAQKHQVTQAKAKMSMSNITDLIQCLKF